MFCPKCQRECDECDVFCRACGKRLNGEIEEVLPDEAVAEPLNRQEKYENFYEKPKRRRSVTGIIFRIITVVIAVLTVTAIVPGWMKIKISKDTFENLPAVQTVVGYGYSEMFFERLENTIEYNEAQSDIKGFGIYDRLKDGVEFMENLAEFVSLATLILAAAIVVFALLTAMRLRAGALLLKIAYLLVFLLGGSIAMLSKLYDVITDKISLLLQVDLDEVKSFITVQALPSCYTVLTLAAVGFLFTLFFKNIILKK